MGVRAATVAAWVIPIERSCLVENRNAVVGELVLLLQPVAVLLARQGLSPRALKVGSSLREGHVRGSTRCTNDCAVHSVLEHVLAQALLGALKNRLLLCKFGLTTLQRLHR